MLCTSCLLFVLFELISNPNRLWAQTPLFLQLVFEASWQRWGIVSGTAHTQEDAERFAKFMAKRDCTLAMIVLAIDPSLLYLIGEPEDPIAVWKKLADQFQKKTWA